MNNSIIQIDGKFYKKCKIVMLPTEKSELYSWVDSEGNKKLIFNPSVTMAHTDRFIIPQHLYIISDEEIKEDDFFLWKDKVYKFDYDRGYGIQTKTQEAIIFNNEEFSGNAIVNHSNIVGKIIASTDPELTTQKSHFSRKEHCIDYHFERLPRLSDAFLKAYCEKGKIEEILVEYKVFKQYRGDVGLIEWYAIKIAPDNTITIKPVKDSWNRKEVINLLRELYYESGHKESESDFLPNWISRNL